MTLLERLSAENREAARIVEAQGRLLELMRYMEKMLTAQGVKYHMAFKGDRLAVEMYLAPPPRVEPPPMPEVEGPAPKPRLTLSEPIARDVPPEVEDAAPESVAVPVEKDVPAPPQTLRSGTYSEAELATIHAMLDEGHVYSAIAAKLGRCKKAVSVKLATVRKRRAAAESKGRRKPPQTALPERPVRPPDQPAPPDPAPPRQRDEPRPVVRPDHSEFPINEKALTAYLDALGYVGDWDAVKDFQLVGLLMQGMKLDMIAAQLKVGLVSTGLRWRALNERIGDLDHQKLLLRVLKQRAGLA